MRRAAFPTAALAVSLLVSCGGSGSGSKTSASTTSTSLNLAARVQTYQVTSHSHVQGAVNYPQTPPVGGDHNPIWQNCGFYPQPIVTELGVHSMEHGAVWITFRPDVPSAQVTVLRNLAKTPYVLVSPWGGSLLPSAVIASAWGVQLKADSATDPGVAAFVKMYAQGPQTPEPGAPCSGGFGNPG